MGHELIRSDNDSFRQRLMHTTRIKNTHR